MTPLQRSQGLLLGAFVGDAISLGAHWIYDRADLRSRFPVIEGYAAPATSYHPGKLAGDFTHLGDQMLVLQKSIASHGGLFDADDFIEAWKQFWANPQCQSYRDKATKLTYANLVDQRAPLESGSPSNEFAGLARGMPVLATGIANGYEEQELIAALKLQTRLTHRALELLDTVGFIGRLIGGLAAGLDMDTALDGALGDSSQYVRDWGGKAENAAIDKLSTGDAIEKLGQTCDIQHALPSTILVLRRHQDDFREAMVQNVLGGGDSAARGIVIGAILGYTLGPDAIPAEWRSGLRAEIPGLA